MKKLSKTLLISLGFLLLSILITAAFLITDAILGSKSLMLRENASNAFFIAIVVSAATFLIFLFVFLVQNAANKEFKTGKRIINGIIAALIFCLLGFSSIFFAVAYAFSSQPEHEVTRDGKKLVGCVNSYLQVEVYYHEYVNSVVMGKKVVLWEDYGNGGYDPFTQDPMPEVKRSAKFS